MRRQRPAQHGSNAADDARSMSSGSGLQRLPAREGQQLLRQLRAALGARAACVLDQRWQSRGSSAWRLRSSSRLLDDHRQQVVEVVGDAAGELADRLHLLRLEQGRAGLFQRLLRLLAAR